VVGAKAGMCYGLKEIESCFSVWSVTRTNKIEMAKAYLSAA
jgi:hypothetical protein